MKRTYYSVLHVLHGDSPDVVHEAYKRVRKSHEPGLLAHDPAIIAEAKLAKEAYETLSDPARRAAYDAEHSISTPSEAAAIGIEPARFWTTTRIVVYSTLLGLVALFFYYHDRKLTEANRTFIVSKQEQDGAKKLTNGKQPIGPAANKPADDAVPSSAGAAPPPK